MEYVKKGSFTQIRPFQLSHFDLTTNSSLTPARMSESYCNKLPVRVIFVWLAVVAICYNLLSVHDQDDTQIMHIPPSHLVDATVFVAMGAMASDPMVDYSIASVRKLGKWEGDIYVVTDQPLCFVDAVHEYDIHTIEVAPPSLLLRLNP